MIKKYINRIVPTGNYNFKKKLFFTIKIFVSISSLVFISLIVDWSVMSVVLVKIKLHWFFLALLIFWLAQIASAIRCIYIVRVLGGVISFPLSLKAHFVGLWFNQILPTNFGGDVVKVALLKPATGLSIALRSAILDRISGLMFLLLAVLFTLPFYFDIFSQQPEISLALGFFSLAGLIGIILFSWFACHLQKSRNLHPIIEKFIQTFADIAQFRFKSVLWQQFWTSAIVHINGIIAFSLSGLAIGLFVDPLTFFLLVPLVFLVALIPISFAGWGVREAGAIWLFAKVGVTSEITLAMSIIFGFLLIIAALPGLLIFLYKS